MTKYCIALCLNMKREYRSVIKELTAYMEGAVQSDEYMLDEYQLPDALYLKGMAHAACKDNHFFEHKCSVSVTSTGQTNTVF